MWDENHHLIIAPVVALCLYKVNDCPVRSVVSGCEVAACLEFVPHRHLVDDKVRISVGDFIVEGIEVQT